MKGWRAESATKVWTTFSHLCTRPRNNAYALPADERAADDLRTIHRSGKQQFGKAQADLYHQRLETLFQLLAENPKLARERFEIAPPVRVHPFGVHLVIYTVRPDGAVLVVRVRHHRENWAALISQTGR